MRFPKRLRHRGKGKVLATIYKRPDGYRLYWRARVDGKRRSLMKDFASYRDAKREGDKVVADLHKGVAPALSPGEASKAVAASEVLRRFYQDTGRKVSLLEAVEQFCGSAAKLGDRSLAEAVDGFLCNVAVVKRKPLGVAVEEFVEGRKHLAEAKDGKRPRHSPVYEKHVAAWLRSFAGTFQNHAACDLTKHHLDTYIAGFKELSAKSRNDRRCVVKMFLRWCVAKDYLAQSHRLFEAVDFKTEDKEGTEIDFYRPAELRLMLEAADPGLVPVIALGGLAGLRREEIVRLEWADVWRVKGKVEISARIAKGRKRRLVDVCPALAAWLRPYRRATGLVWSGLPDALGKALSALRDGSGIPARRNGLRHSFITFHMAAHSNENLTAAEAGNSPQMLHEHYRALATAAEARKWFCVRPQKAAGNIITLHTGTV